MSQPIGRAKGGIARRDKLAPERRSEIARAAAKARHARGKVPIAIRKGNFKEEFGFDVECYVLDDDQKTAVISLRGLGVALGFAGDSGSRLPAFINGARISPYIGRELREKLENPLVFQGSTPGANVPSAMAHGYDVTLLIDLCKAIIKAESEGRLLERQRSIAKQAHVILGASAKAGIKGLVYALTGYDATREEVIKAFKVFVQEEAREYEREFPDQLYTEWYRIYGLPKPERNKPWKFMHLTNNHVYYPLARSRGEILQLTKNSKANSSDRHKRLHQFLSEVGVKALRTHLGQLLGVARISKSQKEYEQYVNTLFGEQEELFEDSEL